MRRRSDGRVLLRSVACVILGLAVQAGGARTGEGGGARRGGGPDFFPVLCWDPLRGWDEEHAERRHGLDSIRDCHFTVAGFVNTKDLRHCEKHRVKVLAFGDRDEVTLRQWNAMWDDPGLSDAVIRERIKAMVRRSRGSKAVLGYYICDEPGTSMFPRLAKAVEYVREFAPGKIAYINLFPNYASAGAQLQAKGYTDYVERFVAEVRPDLLSYDNYQVQYSMDTARGAEARSYYSNLLGVRRIALESGLPFWNIVSSNQIRPHTTIPSPANLYLQAYTSLAAGARGVTWYTYYSTTYGHAPIDGEGRKTLTWFHLREVNRQLGLLGPWMSRLTSTGVHFTSPPPLPSAPLLPGRIVREVEAGGPVMVGEFRGDDGFDFAMIVNLSLARSMRVKLVLQGEGRTVEVVSPADGEPRSLDAAAGHWLVAGHGILLRLGPPASGERR